MKTLVFLVLLMSMSSVMGSVNNIDHDDIIESSFLKIDVDGIELWDISPELRVEASENFTNKCLVEIPHRSNNSATNLLAKYKQLKHLIDVEYKVIQRKISGYGVQLICVSTIKSHHPEYIHFATEYSEIFENEMGTLDICKEKIENIDRDAVTQDVIARRAYFDYKKLRSGEVIFPRCQTLKVSMIQTGITLY